MNDITNYTLADLNKAAEDYYTALTIDTHPVDNPRAYLLGGQGGAGKSTLHNIICDHDENTIIIDGDAFREKHPNYETICKLYDENAANYTQPFVNNIIALLIEKLSSEKYNLIIEGTCRRSDVPLKTCGDLKEKGYTVELAIMCTKKDVSWASTIERYNTMKALGLTPRAVPFDKYNETVQALPQNIETLYKTKAFDDIKLYNRKSEILYQYTVTPEINPRNIFENILFSNENQILPEEENDTEDDEDFQME